MHGTRIACLIVGSAALCALGPMMSGCQEPLFPERAERSPYERYQALRGEAAPKYQRSAQGGGREPALRQRLKPLDTR